MKLKNLILVVGILLSLFSAPVSANGFINPCTNDPDLANSELCRAANADSKLFGRDSIWNNILNTLTFIVGAIAVLMIIIGAIRYATSGGEQAQISGAKNTIIYAVVALVIAVMANAIVNFVLTNI